MGTGAMAVVGGTIIGFVTLSGGSLIAIQGLRVAGQHRCRDVYRLHTAGNTRVAAPIVSGVALAATVGTRRTARLGAMRISEEDAVSRFRFWSPLGF